MKDKTRRQILTRALSIAVLLAGAYGAPAATDNAPNETALIGVLQGSAGWQEKQAACRGLRQVGTPASIPALAALLSDKELSHMARYALEAMPYPEAGWALSEALAKTQGMTKAGVIISIGARRDSGAVPVLIPLLKDADMDVARAAAGALGRIATGKATAALLAFRGKAPEKLQPALAEGLLAAGQYLTQEGKRRKAARLYEKLCAPDWPMYVRSGAFHGLATAQPKQAPRMLVRALADKEPLFRDIAAQIVAETSGADTTAFYARALPTLPPDGQVALLRGLAGRKDSAVRATVAQAALSADRNVELAAVKALGPLGGAADVAALAGLLASDDGDLARAAKLSLTLLQGKDVDPAIAAGFSSEGPRVQLLEVLADRHAEQTLPLAAKSLNENDVPLRIAAFHILASLGGKEQVKPVVRILLKTEDPAERSAAEDALGAISSRVGEEAEPFIIGAFSGASPQSRVALLRAMARTCGRKVLEVVFARLGDPDAQVSDEAVRLLSEWPSLDAAPHLLKLAQGDNPSRKLSGLRGYVRLAGIAPSPEERGAMLTRAMALTKRPDEKMLVLSGWGAFAVPQSLAALLPQLDDAAVQNEAAVAIIAVAAELGKKDGSKKPQAVAALKAVVAKCKDAEIRGRAEKALAGLQ